MCQAAGRLPCNSGDVLAPFTARTDCWQANCTNAAWPWKRLRTPSCWLRRGGSCGPESAAPLGTIRSLAYFTVIEEVLQLPVEPEILTEASAINFNVLPRRDELPLFRNELSAPRSAPLTRMIIALSSRHRHHGAPAAWMMMPARPESCSRRGSLSSNATGSFLSKGKYRNVVSTQLAGQVLEALYELLRGFQAADDQTHGELLRAVLKDDPNHVYAGLLTTLLRLVFVLYAEDRGLLSTDPVYSNFYSVTGLYERLRADAGRYPDTMYQRYGAWAQLLALFRLIYRGGRHGGMRIPAREG